MKHTIVQHHDEIDFNQYLSNLNSAVIGIDCNDCLEFFNGEATTHSFMATASGSDRVRKALDSALSSELARELLPKAVSLMIVLHHHSKSKSPLRVEELGYINDFMMQIPTDRDVKWSITDDNSLGEAVKIVLLLNVKD